MGYVSGFGDNIDNNVKNDGIEFNEFSNPKIGLSNGKLTLVKATSALLNGGGALAGGISLATAAYCAGYVAFCIIRPDWSILDGIGHIGVGLLSGWVAKKTTPVLVRNVPFLNAIAEGLEEEKNIREAEKKGRKK